MRKIIVARFAWQIVLIVALGLALVGCGLTDEEQMMARIYATQYALDPVNNIPPAHYQTLAAQNGYVINVPLATPTPAPPSGPPTMSAYDFSATQIAGQQAVSMTNQANQLQMEREKMAADARAEQARIDARHAEETAVAVKIELTAQAQERAMIATANAQGTQMMWTAQAAATSTQDQKNRDDNNTAVAGISTSAVLPTHAIWTQNAVFAQETIAAGEAAKVKLAVRKQELKNGLDAFLPWGILVSLTVVFAIGFSQFVQTRVHGRDAFGARPLLEMRAADGSRTIVNTDIIETAAVQLKKDGSVVRYAPMNEDDNRNIVRRAQAVDAIRALPSQYAETGKQMVNVEFGRGGSAGRVTIGTGGSISPVLDEAERKFMEDLNDAN